jgi:Fur family ferric uptake transcriptional regulator
MNANGEPLDNDRSAADILRSRKIKATPPRLTILESALQLAQPFHAEQLLELARKIDRAISLATVYRFLALLLEHGLVRQIDLQKDNYRYYEINRNTSFAVGHIICHDCQQVIEVTDPCLSLREKLVANDMGFTPTKLDLRIEADCQELNQKGHCSRQRKTAD